MYENNKAILEIMGNTTHKQTCVLNSGNIENWPESSHKITVGANPMNVISSQKYSEFQVFHLHKQSPPPSTNEGSIFGIQKNIVWVSFLAAKTQFYSLHATL